MSLRNTPRLALVLILVLALVATMGCGSDATGPSESSPRSLQMLQIVGGVGTFAYFQLLWPQVEVAQADDPAFATIEPSASGFLIPGDAKGNHEWFATSYAPWIDSGGTPYPGMEITALMMRGNQTHTLSPTVGSAMNSGAALIPSIARHQIPGRNTVAPLVFSGNPFIGTVAGARPAEQVTSADSLISLYKVRTGEDLSPTPEELALFDLAGAPTPWLQEFGRMMIVAAKALRIGYSNTIVISLPGLDPHDAFVNVVATQAILTSFQTILNGFYTLLDETSHADRVMIMVLGDTPKNPLVRAGWPDGTPGASNWTYVVAKGYLKHGWFGGVHTDGSVSGFDPATGADVPNVTNAMSTMAAAAITYAGTGGDAKYIKDELDGGAFAEYAGVVRTGW